MPEKKKPTPAWKEHPEPEFPREGDRDAYRQAQRIIKTIWQHIQAGQEVTVFGAELYGLTLTVLPPEIGQLTTFLLNNSSLKCRL